MSLPGCDGADDVVRVVEWLKGEPGVEAAHVGLMGYSKGGQMVLLAAARGASVQAVVAYYPPTDLALWKEPAGNPPTASYITHLLRAGSRAGAAVAAAAGGADYAAGLVGAR